MTRPAALSIRSRLIALSAFATLSFAGAGRATTPCLRPTDALAPMVAPAEAAAGVPTNVKPIVSGAFSVAEPALVQDGVTVIPIRIERFETVDGFGATPWLRLLPDAELPPNAPFAVVFEGEPVVSFTTGDGRDDEPPATPALDFIGPYADGACTPFVEIGVDTDAPLTIARLEGAPALGPDVTLHGLAIEPSIVVGGEAEATARVFVAAVDLAGNVSEAAAVEVTFPPEYAFPSGCGAQHVSPTNDAAPKSAALVLLLLVALAPRRRRPLT